ncbi:hypothetical protein LTR53_011628 [Teratosphaeriaceae sp. CCFEE 6253]|nr:hypothetical protein LTR53_011628 [Teratosphaeriaceae sp. CCFEE 6253]
MHTSTPTTALLTLAATLPSALAWGTLGHETIAFIAQHYVANTTAAWAQTILANTSTTYLASVATWADSYRYTAEGAFSAPFHYIDAEDNPPATCNVDFDRDCGAAGCVVSAIANYTARVQQGPTSGGNLSATQANYALRWIVHFVGDITQPLHDEALAIGGNDIDVEFNGTATNLHHIWDTNMPEALRGGYTLADAAAWAENLTFEIDSGVYEAEKASWVSSLDITDAKATALSWAQDANAFVCSVVLPSGGESAINGTETYPAYYESAIGTVELQVAKAGYRLAKWLDAIAGAQAGNQTVGNLSATAYHARKREVGMADLSGRSLLPAPRELSPAKLRRAAVGWGCGHAH